MINKSLDEDHGDEEPGKLFIGGLCWQTTEEKLQQYFSSFGEVVDVVIMKNTDSGQSRGFGFITFSDAVAVRTVMANGPHILDGRAIDPKPCSTKAAMKSRKSAQYPKVFMGGLPVSVTETDIRSVFSRYGEIMDVIIMYDHENNKCRGFGFLSYETDEEVDKCVSDHYVYVNGKKVEVKRAEPRDGRNNGGASDGNHWTSRQNGGAMPSEQASTVPSYQGWGATPSAGYGYGTPTGGPVSYGGWNGPPPQWGAYPQQGYPPYPASSLIFGEGPPPPGYGNWNWNMPQQGGPPVPSGPGMPGPGMSPRPGAPLAAQIPVPGPAAPASGPPSSNYRGPQPAPNVPVAQGPVKPDYPAYSSYTGYTPEAYGSGGTRPGYGNESKPSAVKGAGSGGNYPNSGGGGGGGGGGPQRGNQTQAQSYHPYRRV